MVGFCHGGNMLGNHHQLPRPIIIIINMMMIIIIMVINVMIIIIDCPGPLLSSFIPSSSGGSGPCGQFAVSGRF